MIMCEDTTAKLASRILKVLASLKLGADVDYVDHDKHAQV